MVAAALVAWQVGAVNASAQVTASSTPPVVTPGQATTVTVTGVPGYYYAVVGSTTGSGFAYAGQQFAVGADVSILAMGNLDGNGQAVVQILPPFQGTALDRYYIQVATSPVPNFSPLELATGNVLVNGDLAGLVAAGTPGPQGPEGPAVRLARRARPACRSDGPAGARSGG